MVEEFDAAVRKLTAAAGGELSGLIVDLRYNPGGLLSEAIELSNRFLTDELIVSTKRRGSRVVESHSAEPDKSTLPDLPLVLILNRRSASASEVTAGALQDHDRTRIVGERSYGKGVVQSIYQWENMDFRLKMTTSHYYTPKGRNIEKSMRRDDDGEAEGGLEPDRQERVDDELFKKLHRQLLRNQTPARYRERASALAEELGIEIDSLPDPADDPQLAAALEEILEER